MTAARRKSSPPDWLVFERRGGSAPRDDEELAIAEDGSFTARRTIGGPRIGAFEGKLPAAALARLKRLVADAGEAGDLTVSTPRHGATEVLTVGGHTLTTGSNETPAKPWQALIKHVRALLEDQVTERPRAVLELVADRQVARLVHVGADPIDVEIGGVTVDAIRRSDDGAVLSRWRGRRDDRLVDNGETLVATLEWVTARPGWSAPLPFNHPLELAPGDWLQVWVELRVRDGERERAAQLYRPVLEGG